MTQPDEPLNVELSTPDDAIAPLTDAENLNRQKRSIDEENAVDRNRNSSGLDSLGGGRLP